MVVRKEGWGVINSGRFSVPYNEKLIDKWCFKGNHKKKRLSAWSVFPTWIKSDVFQQEMIL